MPRVSLWVSVLAVVGLLLIGADARADGDPDVDRLRAAGHSLRWNWTPPGRTERYGHAEVLIDAPAPLVRAHVTDYARYKELVPGKFHNSRIIAKRPGETEVYMQVPIMHGMITLWDVTLFRSPRAVSPTTEVVEGTFVRGNIKDMHVVWTIRTLDNNRTLLKCDLLLTPHVPAPQSVIDEELRDAAGQAVDAVHDRAEARRRDEATTAVVAGGASM